MSLDVGAVRLTETELHHDPPRPEELTNAIGARRSDHVDDVLRELPGVGRVRRTLVGVAGTITTLAAVEIGLVAYDRDRRRTTSVLTRPAAEDVFRTLATEPLADRRAQPRPAARAGRHHRRRLLRPRGRAAPARSAGELLVSERDLLDGVAAPSSSDVACARSVGPQPR